MWSLLYAMFTIFLYFLGFVAVLILGLTCPIWIGFLAVYLAFGWVWDGVKEACS